MIKAIEIIVVFTLLIFSFFAGVKYSDSVKDHASWLFETKGEEVELPDLSNESGVELDAVVTESGEVINNEVVAPEAQAVGAPVNQVAPAAVAEPVAPAPVPVAAPAPSAPVRAPAVAK